MLYCFNNIFYTFALFLMKYLTFAEHSGVTLFYSSQKLFLSKHYK